MGFGHELNDCERTFFGAARVFHRLAGYRAGMESSRPSLSLSDIALSTSLLVAFSAQTCSGVVIFLPFLLLASIQGEASNSFAPVCAGLMSAGLALGLGVGYGVQTAFQRKRSLRVPVVTSTLLQAVSLLLMMLADQPGPLLVAVATIAGCGLMGEWTVAAEAARLTLPSTRLWSTLRLYSLTFYIGGLLSALLVVFNGPSLGIVAGLLLCCVRFGMALRLPQQARAELCPSFAPPPSAVPSQDSDDPCDADECCGGGCEWMPTPLWLGVCLAAIGIYAIAGLLPALMYAEGSSPLMLILAAAFGTLLFQSVVPNTGYAVLVLSCLLCGGFIFGFALLSPSAVSGVLSLLSAAVAAAVYSGCSGLTGESFSGSRGTDGRGFVLTMGAFIASILLLLSTAGGVMLDWLEPVIPIVVCVAGIFLLRQIPSPLLSQRRQVEASGEEADRMLAEAAQMQDVVE